LFGILASQLLARRVENLLPVQLLLEMWILMVQVQGYLRFSCCGPFISSDAVGPSQLGMRQVAVRVKLRPLFVCFDRPIKLDAITECTIQHQTQIAQLPGRYVGAPISSQRFFGGPLKLTHAPFVT
jgi:hypothetical protein